MTENGANGYRMLKGQILTTMIILPFVPFILALAIGYYHFTAALKDNAQAKMVRVAEDHRSLISIFLDERRGDLEFIGNVYRFDQLSRTADLTQVFRALQTKSEAFVDLGVFDQRGNHLAYVGPYQLQGKNYAEETWFKEVTQRGHYISNIFLGYRRVPHFVIAVSRTEAGRTWVLRATIDTQFFTDLVEQVRIGRTGEAYVIDRTGLLQTRRRSGGRILTPDPQAAHYLKPHQGVRTFVIESGDEVGHLYATAWLLEDHWLLVVRQTEADAFSALRSAGLAVLLISLIGGGLIVIAAYLLTNRIIGRMSKAEGEKETLSRQLIVAGRLAELGEMAAGFAHEINNPLQIIRAEQNLMTALLDELNEDRPDGEKIDTAELADSIDQIRVQIDRCGSITQSILKFARQKDTAVKEVDPASFIPEVIHLIAQNAEVQGVAIDQKIDPDTPPVQADPAHLQQVLVNLLNNAIDAVVERHGSQGGRVEVGLGRAEGAVELIVSDNGIGIKPEDRHKLFTPFFTTKPVGKGTGLGLSVCFGIIDKMGGTIQFDSREGRGTTFRLLLPTGKGQKISADAPRPAQANQEMNHVPNETNAG